MSLRQRLLVRVALVLGLSLLIGAITSYWRAAGKVRTEMHAAFVVGEQLLFDAVKEVEHSASPFQQLRMIIERFSGGRHLRVMLLDSKGESVMQSRLDMPDEPAPDWFYKLAGGTPEMSRIALPKNVPGYSAFLMEADPRNEVQEFWEDTVSSLSTVAILATLVSALIYLTVGRELRPLANLREALARVGERDFSMRVAEQGPSDLQVVAAGFNQMASRLEEAETQKTMLEEQLSSVQEEERGELARDLHDEIGPLLFSVSLDAAAVQKSLGEHGNAEISERLESIREAVALSQRHVLQILGRLRSGSVEDMGLEAAIRGVIEFWTSRHPHLMISAKVPESGVGVDFDPVVYRIVQESISNAVRHGKPSRIDVAVSIEDDGSVRASVCDDGGGLTSQKSGHGLTGMRERVASRLGTLSVGNRPDGKGVLVEAYFPSDNHKQSVNETTHLGYTH